MTWLMTPQELANELPCVAAARAQAEKILLGLEGMNNVNIDLAVYGMRVAKALADLRYELEMEMKE